MLNKRLINTGVAAAAGLDPLQNFEIVTYTGNGGTQKITGYIRKGAAFNGSSSQINIPHNTEFDATGGLSISVWVNRSNTNTFFAIDKANGGSGNYGWQLYFTSANGYGFQVHNTSNSVVSAESGTGYAAAGTWEHVVGTFSSSGVAKIYVDGVLKDTTSALGGTVSTNTGGVTIGSYFNNTNWLNGKLDQIRFFDTDIDQTAVDELFAEEFGDSTVSTTDFGGYGGFALYQLDKDANNSISGAIDSGQSADFNGSSQIDVSSNSIFDTTSNFTLSMWVNRDSTSEKSLMNKLGSTANGWFLTWNPSYGYWFVNYNGSGTGSVRQNGPTDSVGEWTHLAVTWNASTYESELYINGVAPSSNVKTTGGGGSTNSNALEIGGFVNYSAMAQMDGQIDDVKWFSSVISDSDIEKLSLNLDTTATPVANWKLDGNANDSVGSYNGTWSGTEAYSDPAELSLYNGSPSNVDFLGMAFQPDLVIIKNRETSGYEFTWFDSIRGALQRLRSDSTYLEDTKAGSLTSFDTNGFSLGNYAGANQNNIDHVAWCWRAAGAAVSGTGTSGITNVEVSANTEAGFSIVKYDGGGTAGGTVTHGLDSAPELIIIKRIDSSGDWIVGSDYLTSWGHILQLNLSDAEAGYAGFNSTAPTTSVFTLGSNNPVNNASGSYIAYCFHSTDYQKIGAYTGNGDGSYNDSSVAKSIDIGFRPRFVAIKRTDSADHWTVFDSERKNTNPNYGDFNLLSFNLTDAETTSYSNYWNIVDFTDTGFDLGQDPSARVNANNGEYFYWAIG